MATIRYNTDSVSRPISHTDEIGADIYSFFGTSSERVETRLNGVSYVGPLTDGDIITLVSKANSKAA